MAGAGEHVAPYWKGGGGIVGRPLEGEAAEICLACGEDDAETLVPEVGEDGHIVELLPGCFDDRNMPFQGNRKYLRERATPCVAGWKPTGWRTAPGTG